MDSFIALMTGTPQLVDPQCIVSSPPFLDRAAHQADLRLVDDLKELLGSALGLALLALLLADLVLDEGGVVRVEAQHDLLVAQRVLLLDAGALRQGSALGGAENALDFGAVDQTAQVGLRDDVGRQQEVLLQLRGLGGGAVDVVQGLESGRGPDDEAAKVTTGSQLEEVQGIDGAGLDTGQVASARDELLAVNLGVVDDERATALAVAATTELALTSTELLGLLSLLDVGASTNSLEDGQSGGSLGSSTVLENSRVDNKGDFGDVRDLVATGQQQRGDGGSSQGRGSSESPVVKVVSMGIFGQRLISQIREHSLLALVDLDVPLAPGLGGREHATGTAHVTEGSLTGTVSTTTGDTGNTGNSTTCVENIRQSIVLVISVLPFHARLY